MAKTIIVIPTYNEAENITNLIEQLEALDGDFGIIIVDDNSPDGTGDMVAEAMKQGERIPGRKERMKEEYPDGVYKEINIKAVMISPPNMWRIWCPEWRHEGVYFGLTKGVATLLAEIESHNNEELQAEQFTPPKPSRYGKGAK